MNRKDVFFGKRQRNNLSDVVTLRICSWFQPFYRKSANVCGKKSVRKSANHNLSPDFANYETCGPICKSAPHSEVGTRYFKSTDGTLAATLLKKYRRYFIRYIFEKGHWYFSKEKSSSFWKQYFWWFYVLNNNWVQARSQDLEKGGLFRKSEKSENNLDPNFHCSWIRITRFVPPKNKWSPKKKKSSSPKLSLIFRPRSEIQTFFPPKDKWSPKKKKRSSPKLRLIFRLKSEIQAESRHVRHNFGTQFPLGGAVFNQFFTKNRPQKHQKRAILHTSQAPPPPPPGYATDWVSYLRSGNWYNMLSE